MGRDFASEILDPKKPYTTYLIVNKSLQSGIVPKSIKIAKVVPIYKSKTKNQLSNYRPISLLPGLAKELERVVHKIPFIILRNTQYTLLGSVWV